MITFGLVSSVFDFLTFGVLLLVLQASEMQFRTGWFMESVISATFIVLVIRTRRPFYKSRPGKYLVIATAFVGLLVILLPYSPLAGLLGFTPLPPIFLAGTGSHCGRLRCTGRADEDDLLSHREILGRTRRIMRF